MSMVRDAHYSAAGARYCRANGHIWDGDTCGGCRIKRDSFGFPERATYGISIASGALPVGYMVPVMSTDDPRHHKTDRAYPCVKGHDAVYINGQGKRVCSTCQVDYERHRRARYAEGNEPRGRIAEMADETCVNGHLGEWVCNGIGRKPRCAVCRKASRKEAA